MKDWCPTKDEVDATFDEWRKSPKQLDLVEESQKDQRSAAGVFLAVIIVALLGAVALVVSIDAPKHDSHGKPVKLKLDSTT